MCLGFMLHGRMSMPPNLYFASAATSFHFDSITLESLLSVERKPETSVFRTLVSTRFKKSKAGHTSENLLATRLSFLKTRGFPSPVMAGVGLFEES